MALTLLAAQTGAGQSTAIQVGRSSNKEVTFTAPGLATTETATIQWTTDDGTTWIDLHVDGTLQALTAPAAATPITAITVYGPGVYRVNKDATAASVPIMASTKRNP